jgi:tripartite-type tricarboxylate transporter receptor subunit TctC
MMKRMSRREAVIGLAAVTLAGSAFAGDDGYPKHSMQILVPTTPGGIFDLGARRIGELLRETLGQPVIVDNKPGASGAIATAQLLRSEKDGYTLGMASDSTVLINPLVVPGTNYALEDFQLLSPLYTGAFALAVGKSFPANSVQEFVQEAKRRGSLSCGMFGNLSSSRVVAELFMAATGVKLEPVPYRGESEAVRDVLAGVIPSFFGSTSNALALHKAGNLRILGLSSKERLQALQEVPTFTELGFESVEYTWFHGVMLPAGVPAPIVEKLSSTLFALIGSERFKTTLNEDLVPSPMLPAQFTEFAMRRREIVKRIVQERGLAPT